MCACSGADCVHCALKCAGLTGTANSCETRKLYIFMFLCAVVLAHLLPHVCAAVCSTEAVFFASGCCCVRCWFVVWHNSVIQNVLRLAEC
jgi:hypothetical protein